MRISPPTTSLVYPGPDGKLVYVSDSLGNRIPDFQMPDTREEGFLYLMFRIKKRSGRFREIILQIFRLRLIEYQPCLPMLPDFGVRCCLKWDFTDSKNPYTLKLPVSFYAVKE